MRKTILKEPLFITQDEGNHTPSHETDNYSFFIMKLLLVIQEFGC